MANKKIGFGIDSSFERPALSLIEEIKNFSTPALSDGLNKFGAMDAGIKPILDSAKIAGPALTLRLRPGDNLMLHKAMGELRKGDVLVVDTGNSRSCCIMGELLATAAIQAGAAGIVIDGGIRDILELRERGYPIFYRFICPNVGDKDGPGEIGIPISCGGVPVRSGDIIVGDANGVVVIPPHLAEQVMEDARKKLSYEEKRMQDILNGVIVKADVDELLMKKGVL